MRLQQMFARLFRYLFRPRGKGRTTTVAFRFEEWQFLMETNEDPGSPWDLDDDDFDPGAGMALDFEIAETERAQVHIGGLFIPQGTGIEAYAHWEWINARTIRFHNLSAMTASGEFAGQLVSVLAIREDI